MHHSTEYANVCSQYKDAGIEGEFTPGQVNFVDRVI